MYIEDKFCEFDKEQIIPMSFTTILCTAILYSNNNSLLPVTGKLCYIADRIRPDILVATGEISTSVQVMLQINILRLLLRLCVICLELLL